MLLTVVAVKYKSIHETLAVMSLVQEVKFAVRASLDGK